MRYREVEKALREQGCTMRQGRGSHERWTCPCGQHKTALKRDTEVSAGVVRSIIRDLACLPEGWLQ
jgi:predicted RNA binding protein YcfA (HicA-like mRNA interferase family)